MTFELPKKADLSSEKIFDKLIKPEVEPAPEGTGWRTMESAPKDGTRVDLWIDRPELAAGTIAAKSYRVADAWFEDDNWFKPGLNHWVDWDYATHWMPQTKPGEPAPVATMPTRQALIDFFYGGKWPNNYTRGYLGNSERAADVILALFPTTRPAVATMPTKQEIVNFADDAVSWLCELPDRTSPDDEPDMCLVTGEELHSYLVESLTEFLATTRPGVEPPRQQGMTEQDQAALTLARRLWGATPTGVEMVNVSVSDLKLIVGIIDRLTEPPRQGMVLPRLTDDEAESIMALQDLTRLTDPHIATALKVALKLINRLRSPGPEPERPMDRPDTLYPSMTDEEAELDRLTGNGG